MGHKNKIKPKGIGECVWTNTTNYASVDSILQSVKAYCAIEDGSILSDEEIYKLEELAENPFVKLIYLAANDEGYNNF